MLTADEIKAMPDDEVKARLEACGIELYGPQWITSFAREAGLTPRAIHQWFETGKRPMTWALILAETMAHSRQIVRALKSYNAAVQAIREVSETV